MVSDPSVSTRAAVRVSAMAVSSLPEALATMTVGASVTAVTSTWTVAVVLAVSLLELSRLVAVSVRSMPPE